MSSAGIGSAFDVKAYASAMEDLAAATKRRKEAEAGMKGLGLAIVNASTPQEMADALKAQADATRELADAKAEEATASKKAEAAKPTGANVRKGLHGLAQKMLRFSAVLAKLSKKGLRQDILSQLVNMGVEDGLPEAEALLSATAKDIAGLNADQASIVKTANALGQFGAHTQYDPLIAQQKAVIAGNKGADPVYLSKTYLQVDGRILAESLQRYKASIGNKPLNLG